MKKIITLILGLFIGLMCISPLAAQQAYKPLSPCLSGNCGIVLPPPEIIVVPHIVVRKNLQPIVLRDLSINTSVIGNVATTTYEMIMYNPNPQTLEAEFIFPLAENQTIAAVALDINGKMREGVVVEKEKARASFEDVVRRGADPLLVEKTAGQQFKTRIYPFAPNGTRKIRITLEEALKKEDGQFKYVLPLSFKQKLDSFTLNIEIPTVAEDLPEITTDLADFHFTKSEQVIRSHFEASDYELNNHLSFNVPQTTENQVFAHDKEGRTYFYGNLDVNINPQNKKLPHTVAVLWDTSLSGNKRNIAKEKELLAEYLKALNNAEVIFVPFNFKQGQAQKINIADGDTTALMTLIDDIVYDGATRFGDLQLKEINAEEFLLFSDGLSTLAASDDDLNLPNAPLYTINSATEYSSGKLRKWSAQTYASFINLVQTDTARALKTLTTQPVRIVGYSGNLISEVYPPIGTEVGENFSFAGILSGADSAELRIDLGYDDKNIIKTETVGIASGYDNPAVARLWAIQKIAYLEMEAVKNKQEILDLGQEYSIVTENTSLLVLDTAEDYFRYGITPPEELRNEYNRLQAISNKTTAKDKEDALKDALKQADEVKKWWKQEFDVKKYVKKKYEQLRHQVRERFNARAEAEQTWGAARATDSLGNSIGYIGYVDENGEILDSGGNSVGAVQEAGMVFDFDGNIVGHIDGEEATPAQSIGTPAPKASINIKPWNPDTPYLKILQASKDDELYSDYLKLKIGYIDQPSFYFDITDEFIRRGRNDEALTVLSNILEMQLDNVELLRVAANKLLQMQNYPLAIELFEKITELRGEHPQSFRDLALAYQAAGEYQKAFDTFRNILEKKWHRFEEIKQIIFVEMNNLLSIHPEIDTDGLDKDLIFAMPVDIRIVLSWSTDNTDIDLHVIDPMDEECYYGHKNTAIGGRYPHDFTQGFGPEEFMLKKAIDGKYVIRTNNFGDHRQSVSGATTLYLDLYTNYSRPDQKHERVFVRTENVKDKNDIGDIVWEGNKVSEEISDYLEEIKGFIKELKGSKAPDHTDAGYIDEVGEIIER